MPFGGSCEFADFDACVAANQDKSSPGGYCSVLMAETEASCATAKTGTMKYVYQTVTAATLQASTETATCMISTINPDREGDRVVPEGGNFANFMKSPVLMWAHGGTDGYASVPIGSVTALEVMPGHGVKAEWKWLEGDPFADRIKNAWKQGVIRASSIGFKPITYMKNGTGNDIETWELLELSLCAIPMNPEAVRSLKALGLMDSSEVLRMDDEEKAVPEETPTGSGPQPTPSVPPEPVIVTEPEDEEVEKVDQKEHGETLQTISTLLTQLTALVEEMQSEGYDTEDSAEDVEVELDGMDEEEKSVPMITKSGRVLSSKNELKIKAARAHLDEVMKSIYKQPSEMKPSGMPVAKSLDDIVLNLIDDVVAEPTFTIDPETMRSAIADAVKSQITIPAMESFQRAINLARGRVH
jgi:HK97 family phage prohead protease